VKGIGWASTGLDALDEIMDGLRLGDNVVWQVDDAEDYYHFASLYAKRAIQDGKKLVYMRFAQHKPLLKRNEKVRIYELDARSGFESFSTEIHNIITREGRGTFYLFDCLSDLLSAWATDLMIGNFFRVTCPYLFQLDTVAFFAILRNNHSFKTVARIRETTQVLLDLYNVEGKIYIHPLKVWNRYSPTLFLPHQKEGDRFIPLTSSLDATPLFSYMSRNSVGNTKRNLDYWDRFFLRAEELVQKSAPAEEQEKMLDQLCRFMIGREPRILNLVKQVFSIEDLLSIKSRLIGTGYIGGKSAGMLIARKILLRDSSFNWPNHLEPHDSFYIGSDVFYTYIVENGWWKLRMEQKTREGYFDTARTLREQMEKGRFPVEIQDQFWQVIEYFGQSPIIIRSSSLLEDAFGNAFAGKYESIFNVNQGTPEQRFLHFEEIVRRIFASTMNEDALTYRLQRGLDQQDEQMALLVQRVSGSYRKHYFFPDLAGVGISYNTFVWKKEMDPQAGMLRLVLGLGTRAVNRVENDYPRIVALDAPLLRPHAGMADARKYAQHEVDVLNVEENKLETVHLLNLNKEDLGIPMDLLGIRDEEAIENLRQRGINNREVWILTFDLLLSKTPFSEVMQKMLKTLEGIYLYPVDIEFTVNFDKHGEARVNLLQCRPLQTQGQGKRSQTIPANISTDRILFQTEGNFMGGSIAQPLKRLIYVDPEAYSRLPISEKYTIARLVGKLNKQIRDREEIPTLLMGPGRWGTTTPSLGVPVRFSEINNFRVIAELEYSIGSLMPELSFGTHFFQDLVETDIFYVAIFPERENVVFRREWMESRPNILASLVPEDHGYQNVVKVYNVEEEGLAILADILSQKVACFQ
jgi:hypothetical protein